MPFVISIRPALVLRNAVFLVLAGCGGAGSSSAPPTPRPLPDTASATLVVADQDGNLGYGSFLVQVTNPQVGLDEELAHPTGLGVTITAGGLTTPLPDGVVNPEPSVRSIGLELQFDMDLAQPIEGGGMHYEYRSSDPFSSAAGGDQLDPSPSDPLQLIYTGGPITHLELDVDKLGQVQFDAEGTTAEALIAGDQRASWHVHGEGTITYSCRFENPDGSSLFDPEMVMNPLCRIYAPLFGQFM